MLTAGRKSKATVGGSGFGLSAYVVDVAASTPRTSDFDNPAAFGAMPQKRRDWMEGQAFGYDFTEKDRRKYYADFAKRFYDRVQRMQEYDQSVESGTLEFVTFFSYSNVLYLVAQLKKRSGYYVDADDLFEKMANTIGQMYSHSSSVTSETREDRSQATIWKYVRKLDLRVLSEMTFELKENNKVWDFYARNLNYRYDLFDVPQLVTRKDDGFYASMDFLLPQ